MFRFRNIFVRTIKRGPNFSGFLVLLSVCLFLLILINVDFYGFVVPNGFTCHFFNVTFPRNAPTERSSPLSSSFKTSFDRVSESEFVINNPSLCSRMKLIPQSTAAPSSSCNTSSSSSSTVIIIVQTAANHQKLREAIRATWGNKQRLEEVGMHIAFLFGLQTKAQRQRLIESEALLHNDIIQSSAFTDSYLNLTLKSLSMLRWTNQFCSGVHFLLKVDDNVFIRPDNLLGYIEKQKTSLQRSISGDLITGIQPIRTKSSKWFISKKQYSKKYYPAYTSGPAYVISGLLIPELLSASTSIPSPYLVWEDIFVTGILGDLVGARKIHNRGFTRYKRWKHPCAYEEAISGHEVTAEEIIWLWRETEKLIRGNQKCWRFFPFNDADSLIYKL